MNLNADLGNDKPRQPEGEYIDELNDKLRKRWLSYIQPCTSNLIIGDVGTGKSALAYFLLEYLGKAYNLTPCTVLPGVAKEKIKVQKLVPEHFKVLESIDVVSEMDNAIIFVDEADLQLPIEGDKKQRQQVIEFLSLPRQRDQILLLGFHFPRLVMGRYIPYFRSLLFKRPPFLLEFAGKGKGDLFTGMMTKAEERFAEMTKEEMKKHTYVIAPEERYQGMVENPLASFWTQDLSKIWRGVKVNPLGGVGGEKAAKGSAAAKQPKGGIPITMPGMAEETLDDQLAREFGQVSPDFKDKVIDMDRQYTGEELKLRCQELGLSTTGDKHILCGRLIIKEMVQQHMGKEGA